MPSTELRNRLFDEIQSIPVIDSHWHTMTERQYRESGGTDLFRLWAYFVRDIQSTSGKGTPEVFRDAKTDEEKWQILRPILDRAGNVSYYRHNLVVYRDLFGLEDDELNDDNWAQVNERIREKSRDPDWYRHILKDRCGMVSAVLNVDPFTPDWEPEYSVPSFRMERIIDLGADNRNELQRVAGCEIGTLNAMKRAVEKLLQIHKEQGAVAIKSAHAYRRTLFHEKPSERRAAVLWNKLIRDKRLSPAERKALEDFLVFFLAEKAGEMDLVFQIHTGVQGNWGHVPDSDPTHLLNLLRTFPNTRFDLFHAGYPYSREMGMLAKHYPNVWANMCWMYVITMEGSRQILDEWMDLVPGYRILGFGSDVGFPEFVYGHLVMARHCIADILAKKVERDFLSEEAAIRLARQMLHDNLVELFRLDERCGIERLRKA